MQEVQAYMADNCPTLFRTKLEAMAEEAKQQLINIFNEKAIPKSYLDVMAFQIVQEWPKVVQVLAPLDKEKTKPPEGWVDVTLSIQVQDENAAEFKSHLREELSGDNVPSLVDFARRNMFNFHLNFIR